MSDSASIPSWKEGARAVSPIILGVAPFGLIFGITAANADVPILAAWASSFIIFAGASQIAIVEILDSGGGAFIALFTAIVINLRMMMYSADVGRYTVEQPLRNKIPIAYLLTDQAYLVTAHRFPSPSDAKGFVPFYLGAAVTMWTTWQITTTTGMLLGAAIPESWSLEFAIPLTFMALLVLAIKNRPGLIAAIVAGIVAVAAIGLPYHLGLPLAAVCGVAAGVIADRTEP